MKSKDQYISYKDLLQELKEEHNVHPSGRKVRADAGKPRPNYTRTAKTRADAGKPRPKYDKSPSWYKTAFLKFIEGHTSGNEDDLARDANGIFPPQIDSYYKLVKPLDRPPYRSSVKNPAHPEKLRWRWWFSEYHNATEQRYKEIWVKYITDTYFIKADEIEMWTYDEWSWSYYTQIGGHPNKHQQRIILSYQDYMTGKYTLPELDNNGEIIWRRV